MMNRLAPALALLSVVLVACGSIVPATEPAQLHYTPGPPVVISDATYTSESFSVGYPSDWTVVTSAAFSDTWVVFISPDETAAIVLAIDPDDTKITPPITAEDTPLQRETATIQLSGGQAVTAALVAPTMDFDDLALIFEGIIASLEV